MVGWASGPGLPKKEEEEGLRSENRAPGAYAPYFFSVREYASRMLLLGHVDKLT